MLKSTQTITIYKADRQIYKADRQIYKADRQNFCSITVSSNPSKVYFDGRKWNGNRIVKTHARLDDELPIDARADYRTRTPYTRG